MITTKVADAGDKVTHNTDFDEHNLNFLSFPDLAMVVRAPIQCLLSNIPGNLSGFKLLGCKAGMFPEKPCEVRLI